MILKLVGLAMLVAGIVVGALGALVYLENRYVLSPIWAAVGPEPIVNR